MILYDVELATTREQHDEFVALLDRTMQASRAEPGCRLYRFSVDPIDPLRFFLNEWWESEAALLAHVRGQAFRAFLEALPRLGRLVSSVAYQGEVIPYKRPAI